VTRPTGYKWVARHHAGGDRDLEERSRAPLSCPHRLSDTIEALVVGARRQYGWGAKKLLGVLRTRHPNLTWPARSTVNAVLERHHLLRKNRRRRRWTHPGAIGLQTDRPNQVWPADFKGQFKTGDGQYCRWLSRCAASRAIRSLRSQGARVIRVGDRRRDSRARTPGSRSVRDRRGASNTRSTELATGGHA
jgi:hypothetical protein